MRLLVLILCALVLLSFYKRNDFPDGQVLVEQVLHEPAQTASYKDPFSIEFSDHQYTVVPKFRYELYGLVVSYRHHDGDNQLHKSWGDYINMADICVVWQDNATSPFLNDFKFWNGQFTCNFQPTSDEAWRSFKLNQISNNHLISESSHIRSKVSKLKIGDQIRISGWLSEYSNELGGKRGTSTNREDTGNGACETIYVERFEVLQSSNNPWRITFYGSLALLILLAVVYFFTPYKPR